MDCAVQNNPAAVILSDTVKIEESNNPKQLATPLKMESGVHSIPSSYVT